MVAVVGVVEEEVEGAMVVADLFGWTSITNIFKTFFIPNIITVFIFLVLFKTGETLNLYKFLLFCPYWGSRYGPPVRTQYRVIVENMSSRTSWQVLVIT